MFRLYKLHKVSTSSLPKSKLFDETTFYNSFMKDLKYCQKEVIIESPYMTMPRVTTMLPLLIRLVKRGVKLPLSRTLVLNPA